MLTYAFLARHGETEWNRAGRRQGRLDSPLTDEGLAGAHQVARLVATLPIDAVFSSPLGRATTTAGIYAQALGLGVVVLEDLSEVDHGQWSGLTDHDVDTTFPGEREQRAAAIYTWRFPGGESYADVGARAAVALQAIVASGATNPLVVSHEMIGRMLLRNLLSLPPEKALRMKHPHRVVYRVDITARSFTELSCST